MDILTEAMRATEERYVTTFKRDNGTWSGIEMVNHPTPSGNDRWLPSYSDSREWPDSEIAKKEFKSVLPKPHFMKTNDIKRYFVYMVQCADKTYYTGWTTDVEKRCAAHNRGKGAKYTKTRLPVKVVYWTECSDRSEAMKREYSIKQLPRKSKMEMAKARRRVIKDLKNS